MIASRRLVPFLIFLALASASTAQVLPPRQVEHVTITSVELADEFARLAAHREGEGMAADVVTVNWITANVPAGVDLPETIRNFVAAAHAEWGTRFVLLGGDLEVVPARIVVSSFYPYGGTTEIPCDLYYGGLDGDWNADGDDAWGEPYMSHADPGDDADLVAEVWVGRAPVNSPSGAARFVDGTLHADAADYLWDSVLLWAEVLFPVDWEPGDQITLDGAGHTAEIFTMLAGVPEPPAVLRMSESGGYPFELPLTRANALAQLNSGDHGVIYHADGGWLAGLGAGDGVVTAADLMQLTNAPAYFLATGLHSSAAAYQGDSLYEAMLKAPGGGAAACVGQTNEAFPSNSQAYFGRLMYLLYAEGPRRLGPAVEAARLVGAEWAYRNTVDRWTTLGLTTLGDPALRVGPVPDWGGVTAAPDAPEGMRLTATPNPFNPATVIRYELPTSGHMSLELYALDGRRVAVLAEGARAAGPHEATWRGCDATGRAMPSGVYLARLRAGGRTMSHRLTLVR